MTPRIRQLFRAAVGANPKQYLIRCKMETGHWLLVHTGLKVWQIAEELGYSRTGNFSRDFKRWCRRLPAEVQKAARPQAERKRLHEVTPDLVPMCVDHSRPSRSLEVLTSLPRKTRRRPFGWQPEGAVVDPQLAAETLWTELQALPAAECKELVESRLGFASPALFELLSEKSREQGRQNRQRGVEIAELALASLDGVEDALGGSGDRSAGPGLGADVWSSLSRASSGGLLPRRTFEEGWRKMANAEPKRLVDFLNLEDIGFLYDGLQDDLPADLAARMSKGVRVDPDFTDPIAELRTIAGEAGLLRNRHGRIYEAGVLERDLRRLLKAGDDWQDPAEILDPDGGEGVDLTGLANLARGFAQRKDPPAGIGAVRDKLERALEALAKEAELVEAFVQGLLERPARAGVLLLEAKQAFLARSDSKKRDE